MLLGIVRKRSWVTPDITIQGLMEEKAFLQEIEKERQRASRLTQALTLVVYQLNPSNGASLRKDDTILGLLATSLVGCTREYETKGWYSEKGILSVAILLPATDPRQVDPVNQRMKSAFKQSLERKNPSGSAEVDLVATVKTLGPARTPTVHHPYEDLANATPEPSQHDSLTVDRPIPKWKRLFDILVSTLLLAVTLPITIILALLIKAVSPGPLFFTQTRIGYQGTPFTMLKFRTMRPNADSSKHREYLSQLIKAGVQQERGQGNVAMVKLENDPQIIPFGKYIRASCLDELPQLINVLRGEMSLVGPRPPIPYEAREYEPWHRQRFDVVPGMTGLWQVSGKNKLTFNEMVRLDIRYAHSVSMRRDWKILWNTLPAIAEQVLEGRSKNNNMQEVLREHA